MKSIRKRAVVLTEECVACGSCEKVCPRKAISIYKGLFAKVDESRCVGCGKCVKACPAAVIELNVKEVGSHEQKALV